MLHCLIVILVFSGGVTCYAQTNVVSFLNAGESAFTARKYEVALTNVTKAIELNPQYPDAYNYRGMIKWWLQDYSGAIADYDKAITLNPKCGGFYCNRGQAKDSLKMVAEALADYDKAIELDPTNAQAYFNRGTLKVLSLTNYTEAIADFTKAIELHSDPQEEDLFYWRGVARDELKDYGGAIADYTKSLELNTNADWGNSFAAKTNLVLARKLLLESERK